MKLIIFLLIAPQALYIANALEWPGSEEVDEFIWNVKDNKQYGESKINSYNADYDDSKMQGTEWIRSLLTERIREQENKYCGWGTSKNEKVMATCNGAIHCDRKHTVTCEPSCDFTHGSFGFKCICKSGFTGYFCNVTIAARDALCQRCNDYHSMAWCHKTDASEWGLRCSLAGRPVPIENIRKGMSLVARQRYGRNTENWLQEHE